MPYGTKKRRTCGSKGGTRKQRGGFPFSLTGLKSKAAGLVTKVGEVRNHVENKINDHLEQNPTLQSGLSSAQEAAAGITKGAVSAVTRMRQSQHAKDIREHFDLAHKAVKDMAGAATAGAASAARTAARASLSAAISKYEMLFPEDKATLDKMQSLIDHGPLNPNAGAQLGTTMGGRKRRGHKKRHATKKRGHKKSHKKRGHKKRHATKKRGHKKRKHRGGKCSACIPN